MMRLSPLGAGLLRAGMLTAVGTAFAQQTPEANPKPGEVQEVVVTAQKRLQATSKVPISLSVIDSDDIKSKGVSTAANLTELAPNVQAGVGFAGGMEITIRGIGNADNTERGDPQVAFHLDGIYIGRPQGAGASFFDLERIEVLRGPQGTLYGRNANAGAVNVITRRPVNRVEGLGAAEFGNYNTLRLEAMVNAPVSDSFALRAVVSRQEHDGYSDTANAANGFGKDRDDQDNLSGRVLGLVKLSPTASLLLGVDGSRDKGAGPAFFDITSGTLPTTFTMNPQVEGSIDNHSGGALAELNYGFGNFGLTYLFGHRTATRKEVTSWGDAPSIFANFSNEYRQNSHELRLASTEAGPLEWVTGLYWFEEVGSNIDLDVLLPPAFGGGRAIHFVQNPAISKSAAVFGQATYAFQPGLRGTLGLRYTRDEKSREGQTRVGPDDTPLGVVGNSANGEWSKPTYRLGLDYDLTPATMLYGTISTGYKAGGFNDGNSVVDDPNYNPNLYYKPESITAYETGLKGRFLDNTLNVAASLFYYDYEDLQKSAVSNNTLVTLNAAKAAVKGFELEGRAATSTNGRLNFAVGLLSAKYKEYIAPNGQNLSGQPLDRAPRATVVLGYTHNFDLSNGARLVAYAGTYYSASYVLSDTGTQAQAPRVFTQPSYTKTDATVTYESADDRWNLQAYVKNIGDNRTLTAIFNLNGQSFGTFSEPRTYGVRGTIRF